MSPKRFIHRRRRTRGQALVEFALVLPVFLLLLCGVLDFGFMLFNQLTVGSAAREGARAAVIIASPTDLTVPAVACSAATATTSGSGIVPASSNCTGSGGYNLNARCVHLNGTQFDCSTWKAAPTTGDSVSVNVTYQYHTFFPLLFGATFQLGSGVQMAIEPQQ